LSMNQVTNPEKNVSFWGEVNEYWFGFGSATTLGIFRILASTVIFFNLILISFDFGTWFSEQGFVPLRTNDQANGILDTAFTFFGHNFTLPFVFPRLNLLANVTDTRVTLIFYIITAIAAFLTIFGLWTRLSSIVMAVGFVSLQHRNILILHGGDTVLRLCALYIAIAPSGAACSLDRIIGLWRGTIEKGRAMVSLWPQRLVQFNVALIYFTTWWLKMDGDHWRGGTATYYVLRLNEFHRFWVPAFMKAPGLSHLFTYMTVATELAMGTFVFYKPARKWVLLAAIGMHLSIEYSMNIPMFAFSIIAMYITFYEGTEIDAWAIRVGAKLKEKWNPASLEVQLPAGQKMKLNPSIALAAADPFRLITYEPGESEDWTAHTEIKPVSTSSIWFRLLGFLPWNLVPGVGMKILTSAIEPIFRSAQKKSHNGSGSTLHKSRDPQGSPKS